MPGFHGCSWCDGKGCMCCEAEERKQIERQKARAMAAAEARERQLANPGFIAFATSRVLPAEAEPLLRPDPRSFRYCLGCNGEGCGGCDDAEAAFLFAAIESAMWWRREFPDVRDLRDAVVRAETVRALLGLDSLTRDQVDAIYMPAFDAEYLRQFPNGPTPMFTADRNNPDDMALMGAVFGREALKQVFGPGGGGIEELDRRAEVARLIQSGRMPLYMTWP